MKSLISTLFLIIFVFIIATFVNAAQPPNAWKGRRIYQIMTDRFAYTPGQPPSGPCNMNRYCGGTFAGASAQLQYIKNLGFDAIWISPVPVQINDVTLGGETLDGYHGYWMRDLFKINEHFGGADELTKFVQLCHAMDIWVIIDIVLNHVGPLPNNDYSKISPFNESSHYHKECQVTQYQCESYNVKHCRLANLPDLDQDNSFVSSQLMKYVKWLLSSFKFDGIRADTVMYINNQFWETVTDASQTLIFGEVWSDWACNIDYTNQGVTSTLNYDLYNKIRDVFQNHGSMRQLGENWRRVKKLPHPELEVNFVDNQDNSRFLNATNNLPAYRSALSHMFYQLGIPIIYYGTEQYFSGGINGNYNRAPLWTSHYSQTTHMYSFIKSMNDAYLQFNMKESEPAELWQDNTMYCYSRGQVLHCSCNSQGTAQTRDIPNLPFHSGQTICDFYHPLKPCVQGNSKMSITVESDGDPILLYAKH